jgi:hypothetical protein
MLLSTLLFRFGFNKNYGEITLSGKMPFALLRLGKLKDLNVKICIKNKSFHCQKEITHMHVRQGLANFLFD